MNIRTTAVRAGLIASSLLLALSLLLDCLEAATLIGLNNFLRVSLTFLTFLIY